MIDYEALEPNRVRHLELIQDVIGRLGNHSFLVKGWSVTVTGAFLGFAVKDSASELALVGVLPSLSFWALDTYMLRSERLFRLLYDQVRSQAGHVEPFFMDAASFGFSGIAAAKGRARPESWGETLRRPTLAGFYGGLIAFALAVAVLIA